MPFRTISVAASVAVLLGAPGPVEAQSARPDTGSPTNAVAAHGVWGAVQSADGTPVAGAVVRAAGTTAGAVSDGAGTYVLPALPAGIDTLHVDRTGYQPLTLAVIVPASGRVRVDLVLDELPVPLAPVRIVLRQPAVEGAPGRSSELGEWEWDDDGAGDFGGVAGDVLGVLRASPGAGIRPDAGRASLLGAGAGAPPVRLTVDGLPVWAPLHATGLLSMLTPDLVGGLRLNDGTASARGGAAFSGTLDARTREETIQRAAWSGAISPVSMRAAWGAPLQMGSVHGHVLVTARHATTPSPSGLDADGMLANPWSDAGGVLALHRGRSSLEVVALTSTDRLHARLGDSERLAAVDTTGGQAATDVEETLRAPWHSSTVGAVWTRSAASDGRDDGRLEARVWRSDFGAGLGASLSRRATAINDTMQSVGAAAELAHGATRIGASIENVSTQYVVTRSTTAGGADSTLRHATLRASPAIVAAYAERRWSDTASARSAVVGLRASDVLGGATGSTPLLEPHVALTMPIAHAVRLGVGYARTHQVVQSVWSTEPVLSQIAPVALPVAARAGSVPVLTGDVVSASVRAPVTSRLTLDVTAFGRDFHGMLVPAESDADAASPVTTAAGGAAGASIVARGDVAGISWTTSYRMTRTVSSAPLAPGLGRRETSRDLALTLGAHVGKLAELHLDGWLGTPERPGEGDVLGRAGRDDADAAGESDIPTTTRDRVSAASTPLFARAPRYSRLDLTLDRRWSLGSLGALDGVVTLANVLGHTNTALALPDPGEAAHAIRFTPRSILLGIAWRQR